MLKKLIFILVVSLLGYAAMADPNIDLIKKSGDSKKYPGESLILIFDSTKVDMQESGLSYYTYHLLYKVLSTEGAKKISALVFDYDPLSAFIEIKKAVIYRQNGKVETIDGNRIYDYPAPARAIYWGARQKMVDVGRLEPGDAVEIITFKKGYTYALLTDGGDDDEKYIPPMKGHFYDIVPFWTNMTTLVKNYELVIPETKKLQYQVFSCQLKEKKAKVNGKQSFSFTLKNLAPFIEEERMVAATDVAPELILSTSPDWQSKSRWFYQVNEDYGSFVPTKEVKQKVTELLKNAKTELDSISVLTHWVADNMRYSGLSMGKGEGYTLHNAKMNFTDRCGVCKDKASLLISMLRAAGFETYAAMTMAGSRIDDIPADQFNHSVTAVRLKDKKIHMLDPTWVPFVRELWSSAEQQQNYLVGTKEGEDLMETPISPPENHYLKINGKSTLNLDGTLEGEFTLKAEGQTDATVRGIFLRNYTSDWKYALEREIFRISPQAQILSMDFGNPVDYSNQISITVKYKIPDYAIVSAEEIIFTPFIASNLFKNAQGNLSFNTSLEKREYPFRTRCSQLVELNETITIPANKEVLYLPKTEVKTGSGADYQGGYTVNNNQVQFTLKTAFKKRIYTTEDWESFRYAVMSQNKLADEKIIIKK